MCVGGVHYMECQCAHRILEGHNALCTADIRMHSQLFSAHQVRVNFIK